MAHFAKIENGIVTQVIVVDNEHEANGQEYLNNIGITGTWVQTSYNATFGKKFAAIGDTYNNKTKEFKPAQPFASWKFDNATWDYYPPVPYPDTDVAHAWNEETKAWVAI